MYDPFSIFKFAYKQKTMYSAIFAAGILLVLTIVFATLYGIEASKTQTQSAPADVRTVTVDFGGWEVGVQGYSSCTTIPILSTDRSVVFQAVNWIDTSSQINVLKFGEPSGLLWNAVVGEASITSRYSVQLYNNNQEFYVYDSNKYTTNTLFNISFIGQPLSSEYYICLDVD
jgi:hypothetical protein